MEGPRELEAQKNGWFSCLVWDGCYHALPLWTQLVAPLSSPAGVGRPPVQHSGCPSLSCLAGPSSPQGWRQQWWQRQQPGGREKERPPARHRETFPVALPTGQILSGLGGAPLLFCAGLECGNQSPAPWCGRWGYIPQTWRGQGRHQTCQAGLPGVRRGPAHHTPRLQTPRCLHPSPSLKLENSLQS